MIKSWLAALFLVFLFSFGSSQMIQAESFLEPGVSSNEKPKELDGVGVDENLGQKIDLKLEFNNEEGELVPLSTFFNKKPVLLALIYYNCPSLCNFQLNGITETLKEMKMKTGNEFEFVIVSIEPKEGPAIAKAKKEAYLNLYGKPEGNKGWHFLTGTQENITALATQVGFKYKWVESRKEYAHTAASYVLSSEGMISRYLYGISFTPNTLRLSLVEASKGEVGTALDKFLLYCFIYDPNKRGYSFYAYNVMRAGAGVAVSLLALFLVPFWLRQRKQGLKEKA